QPLDTGGIGSLPMQGTQRAALGLGAGECRHPLLTQLSGALQRLELARGDHAALILEHALQLLEQLQLLTKQFREVLAAERGIHASRHASSAGVVSVPASGRPCSCPRACSICPTPVAMWSGCRA